jgi:hypothetical protein
MRSAGSRLRLIQALGSGVDTFDTTALHTGHLKCQDIVYTAKCHDIVYR